MLSHPAFALERIGEIELIGNLLISGDSNTTCVVAKQYN
jgi:hypothetical protein